MVTPVQPVPPPLERDDIHQHPEKLLTRPMADALGPADGRVPSGSGFLTTGDQGAMRGPLIHDQIQGVAVADLTGDGRLESVFLGRSSIWIYGWVQDRFAKMAHMEGVGNYVGVDTADLDGDGRHEIFVTNVDNNDGRLNSFVLALNGQKLERRADNLRYYFRAVNLPQRGRVLLGQRQAFDGFFSPGLFEMTYEDGQYGLGPSWKVPRSINVFGVGIGTFAAGEADNLVAFSESRYLQLLNRQGKTLWSSPEHFGGCAALIQKGDINDMSKEGMRYLPARIEVLDVDKDGVDEVVVMRNQEISGSVLERTRLFKNGRMEVLKADALGLTPHWFTRNLAKFISDFALADLDGDGRPEIVAAVVQKTDTALGTGQSQIYVFK
jgi:hypothetical protein